ncbi:MAG: hypothetical protein IH964_02335, partial [Candidatus Dadabacteria bacterium]|nr:hypothetical protein [Candidatus Dadabacteria bacterium]
MVIHSRLNRLEQRVKPLQEEFEQKEKERRDKEKSFELINEIMEDRTGLGETGETYLIGTDLLMRTDSWREQESRVLKMEVDTESTKQWLENVQERDA